MNRVVLPPVCVLACLWVLASCGSDGTVYPSFVARTWSLQIGGATESHPAAVRGAQIELGGSESVRVLSAHGSGVVPHACCNEWPLVIDGETDFSLPPPPQTREELLQTGLRLVGVTYCSFLNDAGVPREQDVRAVDEALSSLLSVLEAPLLEATPNDEEVSRVTELAAEALLKDVLSELEIPESEEEMLDAQGNQGLWFIGELRLLVGGTSPWGYGPGGFPSQLTELIDVLPSLVWVRGDPRVRSTLSACGSMLFYDAPDHLVRSELHWQVADACSATSGALPDICSLQAYERSKPRLSMEHPDLRRARFAAWDIEPVVQFDRDGQ